MEILAVIPARGGSKGITHKNIRLFNGRPLLSYAIKQARQSHSINRIIVSTESRRIAAVARRYGADIPFLRPAALARDNSRVVDAVLDILKKLKQAEQYQPDILVLLQPTSPLRFPQDIEGAIELFLKRRAAGVVSVCRTEQLLFTKSLNQELRLVSSRQFLQSSNRQELPPTYKLDGSMVYVVSVKEFWRQKTFLPRPLFAYVIPRWRALDLDESEDFVVGALIHKNVRRIKAALRRFQ